MFEKELEVAKQRHSKQAAELAELRAAHAEALSRGLAVTAESYRLRIKRFEAAVAASAAIVKELGSLGPVTEKAKR